MATRGVFQLAKLRINYCEVGGSSRFLREYIGTGRLSQWAASHPQVEIEVKVRNGKHPNLHAEYKTNKSTKHQVCLKDYKTAKQIDGICDLMFNRSGRKIKKLTNPVVTDTPTIQGVWTPFLDMNTLPEFNVCFQEK